jgi:hypothetical protein
MMTWSAKAFSTFASMIVSMFSFSGLRSGKKFGAHKHIYFECVRLLTLPLSPPAITFEMTALSTWMRFLLTL